MQKRSMRSKYLSVSDLGSSRGAGGASAGRASAGAVTWNNLNVDWRALLSDGLVIKVEEVARGALVELLLAVQGKGAIWADGKSAGEDGADLSSLWVELELAVGDDGACAALGVGEDALVEIGNKGTAGHAGSL